MPDFSPIIIERFRERAHAGVIADATRVARVSTPASDAVLEISVLIEGDVVRDMRFRALGCVATIATADWLCDFARTRAIGALLDLTATEVAEALSLPAERRHCAVLACDALKAALADQELRGTGTIESDQRHHAEAIE